jgi:hypothetical protein
VTISLVSKPESTRVSTKTVHPGIRESRGMDGRQIFTVEPDMSSLERTESVADTADRLKRVGAVAHLLS